MGVYRSDITRADLRSHRVRTGSTHYDMASVVRRKVGEMTPLGHLAAALLAVRGAGFDRRQSHLCLLGALLPDIVDKPLWRAGVFVTGHTVGHSVIILCIIAGFLAVAPRLRVVAPVVLGQATHIGGDLIVAYPLFLRNFAWPLLTQRPTPDGSPVQYWVNYATSGTGAVELTLVVAAAAVLVRCGYPSDQAS